MNEQINILAKIVECLVGSYFIVWAHVKCLKENTFDNKTDMGGFAISFVKYFFVTPILIVCALLAFALSMRLWAVLISTIIH